MLRAVGALSVVLALCSPARSAFNGPVTGQQTVCVTSTTNGAWTVTWSKAFSSATYQLEATTINAAAAPNQTIVQAIY